MKFILTAKHWQVFLILIFGLFINSSSIEGNPTLTMSLSLAGTLIYLLWPLLVGHCLQEYMPRKVEVNYTLFLINAFVFLIGFTVLMIASDGKVMSFNGLAALPMFYWFFAFLYYLAFPGKTLRSIENNRTAHFGEYIGDFFLIVFLPIGIWFIQPRINKIVNEQDNEKPLN